jgi:hypothetical protein
MLWPLYPREWLGTYCIGGWVGPKTGLEGCGNSRPPLEFDRRHVQPVASRYTHYSMPTASNILQGTILGSNTDLEQFHPLAISFARICDKLVCRKALCVD